MPGNTAAVHYKKITGLRGFNEAPAGCRGILAQRGDQRAYSAGFNEAPAGCRGIRGDRMSSATDYLASMRPRLDAGEYSPLASP